MAKEQERKFILKRFPLEGKLSNIHRIKQGYLMLDGINNLRVRINNDKAYMTYKQAVNDTTKKEFEYEIPMADALELYEMAPHKLEKLRYTTTFNGNHVDIDVYTDNRMVVEIEYEDELTELPDYCGEEVTGKPEWSNIQMAIDNKKQDEFVDKPNIEITKKYYRVCHIKTLQGLWYDYKGRFTGLIHEEFSFCANKNLEMDFDPEIVGWLSATESLETLFKWFTQDDIKQLQKHGWFIHEFEAGDVKFYERFQHLIIKQDTSKVLRVIEL